MKYHSYIFFDSLPSIHTLSSEELGRGKELFIKTLESSKARSNSYSTLSFKKGTRFVLHLAAESPEEIQNLVSDLLHTPLGVHLQVVYTLFGISRPSTYNPNHAPKEADPDLAHRYLVVYPFTKTIDWHFTPYDDRRGIMKAHVDIGRKYSDRISQMLLYAYGVDDHEFIVTYMMDSLEDFQSLVMEMRETESRRETKNDLPIFLCIHKSPLEVLEMI